MGSVNPFKKPKVTSPAPVAEPEPTPTISDEQVQLQKEEEKRRRAMQKGRAATVLSTGDDSTTGGLASKKLLGG